MTHASVFSGIGGPEVAAAMLGWENLFHCEINPFGRAVLQYWFPKSKSYEDITKTDFSEWGGKVNVLTGGFPCQPFSYAGQRRGADDDRYLWPYMHRCINQVRPDWVVCENVAGILTMVEQGDVTEMAAEKSLFDEGDTLYRYRLDETFTLERICNDLENDGYAVQAVVIPACAVNAPHRRDRVFIIGSRINPDIQRGSIRRGGESDAKHDCRRFAEHPSSGWNESKNNPSWPKKNERSGIRDVGESSPDTKSNSRLFEAPAQRSGIRQQVFGDERRAEVHDGSCGLGSERTSTRTSLMHLNGCQSGDGYVPDPIRTGLEGQDQPRCGETGQRVHLRRDPTRCHRQDDKERTTATDTDYGRLSQRMPGGECEDAAQSRAGLDDSTERPCNDGKARRCREYQVGERWADFPTVSPVHRGNDGLCLPPYYDAIYQARNNMDRDSVIQGALSTGQLDVDFETGEIYSSRIRGHEGERILLKGSDCNGYTVHTLSFNGVKKQCRAHQIVWIAANGLYDKDKLQIDHINRDRKDNRLCNLRLVSVAENIANSERKDTRILGDKERIEIWQLYNEGHTSIREIADDYGVSKSLVHNIIHEFPDLTISPSKWRTESLKAYGNAIVPQVMYEIFKAIEETYK